MKYLPPNPTILAILAGVYFLFDFISFAISPQQPTIVDFGFGVGLFLAFLMPWVFIAYLVLQTVFLYKLWKLVQTSDLLIEKPTPGEAVGYWFIPFYGLFWTFILWKNLALHLNHMTGRKIVSPPLVKAGCWVFIPGAFGGFIWHTKLFLISISPVFTLLALSFLAAIVIFLITNYQFYKSARTLLTKAGLNKVT